MNKLPKYWVAVIDIVALTIVLNIIACSKEFCDWYTVTVYRFLNAVIGTLTGWIPFALGEIIMYIGAAMLLFIVIFGIFRLIFLKKKGFKIFYAKYLKTCLMVFVLFLLVYTTNWLIPIRGHVLVVEEDARTVFTDDELEELRTDIVNKLNELSAQVARDEKGYLITDYDQAEIAALMEARSDEFPKLKGHYSPVKEALCSPALDMMNIGGYNYIYTMEPTCNRYVDKMYSPVVVCHELCHHKGYYLENEGSFLSVVILTESDNLLFQYSGYRELYSYVNNACKRNYMSTKMEDPLLEEEFLVIAGYLGMDISRSYSTYYMAEFLYGVTHPQLNEVVVADISNSRAESEELYHAEVNEKIDETISEPVGKVSDKGWEAQSNILKENIYDGMLLMYLQYYFD